MRTDTGTAEPRAEFNEVVRKLAQYRPFDADGNDVISSVADLVLAAAAFEGDGFETLAACQTAINDLWRLEIEIDEIRRAVDLLETRGDASRVGGGFVLSESKAAELRERERESQQIEELAFTEWATAVRLQHPELTDEHVVLLKEDLRAWLGQVIARHGVESSLLLFPENPRAHELFAEIEDLSLTFLPKRDGVVGAVREWAFQCFVKSLTHVQRRYLASLLNTAFHLTVLTLDPAAGRVLKDQISGQRIYLDTNFIYALLGLGSTANETLAAARLLELTTALGYELAVTSWTTNELRTSLRSAERRLSKLPLPRQDLAALMVMKGGETAVTKAYWMKYHETGVRPRDFFDYYKHVESVLKEYDVTVHDEGCTAVEQNRGAIDEQLVLLGRFMGAKDKEDVVLEHDVKHRLLIERLRGAGHIGFSNARFWFLTRDSKLPRYAMSTLDGSEVALPFCVSTSAWMQVIRAFTPRTDDFDQSLTDLIATPYLRYTRGPGVRPAVVDAVIARVDQYKGGNADLAAEVLADTALVEGIGRAESPAEQDELIDNALISKSEELRIRAEAAEAKTAALAAEANAKADEIERLEKEQREVEAKADLKSKEATQRIKEQRDRFATEKEGLEDQIAAIARLTESQLSSSSEDLSNAETSADEWRRRFEVLAAASIGVLLLVIAIVPVAAKFTESKAVITVLWGVVALGLCGAIRVGFGPKHGPKVLYGIVLFVTFVSVIALFAPGK